jgi:hypothetical protein
MSAGEASGALIAAVAIFLLGSGLILNPANLTARMHQRNVEWWSRRSRAIRAWGFPQELAPFWLVRYGVGLWFCACAVALAIAAGQSL